MRLLLINPKFPESFWSFKWVSDELMPKIRTTNPPLGLATLAALCPDHWTVEIVDENIQPIPQKPDVDIVGICGMGVQFKRQKELLTFYKKQGYHVVAGGSYASLCPEQYAAIADAVIAGEAEYIWKEYCLDYEAGRAKSLYQETGEVDLTDSPTPRFDLLDLPKYQNVSLQFSRGCPFRCEFCDIIVMFGRKPRTKSLEQVGKELDALRNIGVHNVFFVDDNLIGHKKQAKGLLRFLTDYQRRHAYRFGFGTEASLDMAQDNELLTLFKKANFRWVFIGLESPDEESLKETKKFQNVRQDMFLSIKNVYAHGIEILAGFIIGFDNDTMATFEKQYRFVMKSGIQAAMIGLLTALPKTPLYERLEKENRLRPYAHDSDNTKLGTNIEPKQMTYDEMVRGYHELYGRLVEPKNIAARIRNKMRYLDNPSYDTDRSLGETLTLLYRFFTRGLLPGGFPRISLFLRSLPFTRFNMIPIAIKDWIIGLAMRDYVERHFILEFEQVNQLTHNYLKDIERLFQRYLHHGALDVSLDRLKNAAAHLRISLKSGLDKEFFAGVAHHLEKVLEDTASSITLRIEELHEGHVQHLEKLLKRISRYGDRVNIVVKDAVRDLIEIDSSIFPLVFER